MPPPQSRNNNPNVPNLPKLRTGFAAVDTWLIRIIDILNPVLKLGTTMLQGRPLPAPVTSDDGKSVVYDAKADVFRYATSSGGTSTTLATDTIFGVSRLSLAAVDTADPIVVGDNDPRNSNKRTPVDITTASGPIGDATHVAAVTRNAAGQVTVLDSVPIAFPPVVPTTTTYQTFDDFDGYQISLRWNQIITGSGDIAPTRISTLIPNNGGDNACGNVDFVLVATGDWVGLDWGGSPAYLNSTSNPFVGFIEWCFVFPPTPSSSNALGVRFGFGASAETIFDATGDGITMGYHPSSPFVCVVINLGDGGGDHVFPTIYTTGSPRSTFKIVFPAPAPGLQYPQFYVDGLNTNVDISGLGTFPSGALTYLQPVALGYGVTVSGDVGHVYVDYFEISRVRPENSG